MVDRSLRSRWDDHALVYITYILTAAHATRIHATVRVSQATHCCLLRYQMSTTHFRSWQRGLALEQYLLGTTSTSLATTQCMRHNGRCRESTAANLLRFIPSIGSRESSPRLLLRSKKQIMTCSCSTIPMPLLRNWPTLHRARRAKQVSTRSRVLNYGRSPLLTRFQPR